MSILVTGFEPFGSAQQNPSAEIAAALSGTNIGGLAVTTAVLPVEFDAVGPTLNRLLEHYQPQVVLNLGLAEGTDSLRFERVAINLIDARIPDNAGAQPIDQPVLPDAPTAYFSTLPLKAMSSAAAEFVPSVLSFSAGSYVCNTVMFHALHATAGTNCRAGFLHVPPARVLAVEQATQAVRAALSVAVEATADLDTPGGTLH